MNQPRYANWLQWLMIAGCVVALGAAWVSSAMRLHYAGIQTFAHGLDHPASAAAAGVSMVILAESAQIVSTLALIFAHDRKTRFMLWATVFISTAIAVVGNVYVAKPIGVGGEFFAVSWSWLDAVAPPIMTIAFSMALKGLLLKMALVDDSEPTPKPVQQAKELHLHVEAPQLPYRDTPALVDEILAQNVTVHCEHCGREFSKPTKKAADRALNTHLKKCNALVMSMFANVDFEEKAK